MIKADGLSVGYEGKSVVSELRLSVEAGTSLALVGVNGSGKSTLLKTIAGLIKPIGGSVSVLGDRPGAKPAEIAYLSQFHETGSVLPLRAADVVRMARYSSLGLLGRETPRDRELVDQAIEEMGVSAFARKPLHELSGGQRQRVFLALALARDAKLYLWDEPAAGLDHGAQETYRRALRTRLQRGAAALIATHDLEEARACDATLLLAHRVVAYGAPAAVLTPQNLRDTFGHVAQFSGDKLMVLEGEHGHDEPEC
jgi:ABC-type Mn2+/Zn2+ transport system ATPase subunit